MTFIKESQRKSQNVNSCIKPVHVCLYRVRDLLCTCYILSHSGWISSPSYRHRRGITSPFFQTRSERKRCTSDPRSVPGGGGAGDSNLHPLQPRYRIRQPIGVWNSCVLEDLWCLEDGLWSCCFWQFATITAWNNSVSEVEIPKRLRCPVKQATWEYSLYFILSGWVSGPNAGSTSHCSCDSFNWRCRLHTPLQFNVAFGVRRSCS